jgi:biopolymer transport protein ExbD
MAKRIHSGDDAKLNMTPMIDITFLLVVFFMLTIDLTNKEFFPVDLPFATQGEEDKDDTVDIPRFVINLTKGGDIMFKGRKYSLASEDPGVQDDAVEQLKVALREVHGNDPRLREKDQASRVPVMIHADWQAPWKYVQWIMQACADESIKIYKLQFAVKKSPDKEV